MAARTYYRRGEIVPFEEDIHHEFKGHRTVSIDNRLIMSEESVGWGQGELGEYSTTRQQWSKYLCGMINTGLGGTLYGGIQDDGRVTGFMMTHYQQEHVRVQLEDVLERFDPPVVREQYMVRFVPIVEEGEEYLARPALLDPSLEKFDHHNLRSIHRCWCDNEAAAAQSFGIFFPFYVIEVEIKPQRDKITYKAEDGCSYQRQHGSTSNIDNIKRDSQLDCYRCGKPGHKADNCTLSPTVRHNRRQDTGRHDKSRQERKSGKVVQLFCYECEEMGHSVRQCPRLLE